MLNRFVFLCLLSLVGVAVAQEVEGNGKASQHQSQRHQEERR